MDGKSRTSKGGCDRPAVGLYDEIADPLASESSQKIDDLPPVGIFRANDDHIVEKRIHPLLEKAVLRRLEPRLKGKGKEIKHVRFVTALWPEAIQLMYRKDSGIQTLADFKDKKIAVGPAAGGGVFYMPIIMKEYNGMTFDDFEPQYLGYGDSVQALQNGLIAACYLAAGLPTSAVAQMYAGQVPVGMIEFSDEEIGRIVAAAPFFTKVVIPEETYPKQKNPLQTVAIKCSLICDQDVSEDLVYNMLNAYYVKHLEEAQKQHGSLRFVTLEESVKGLTGAPLHPGAVRFYKEKGLSLPDYLIPPEMK